MDRDYYAFVIIRTGDGNYLPIRLEGQSSAKVIMVGIAMLWIFRLILNSSFLETQILHYVCNQSK